ncbi:methyltransferase [Ornithinibacillus halophilus]|uniref:Methyltransferase domain-containing protein n=1 Tax=Ornithinibacillus halophilus TaxID=930117 RepID=A0A1M5E0E8_9BACI|nr:methyltransferase [Ornithinibacillus halophilus]SHF72584.1 Methyltransferase domain-containing protein [Ornithinibacillus halophilus]
MKEYYYEKLLNINTKGKQSYQEKDFYHPYEPTPYRALEVLLEHVSINQDDCVVDFGCGKGRLNFYLHYFHHVNVTGVERDGNFYQQALDNLKNYKKVTKRNTEKVNFYNGIAEEYPISHQDNLFYFFNPFSITIFIKVLNNILLSYEQYKRDISIVLYYPSKDYIFYLEDNTILERKKEVIVPAYYEKDDSERFLIYGFPN